MLRLPIPDFLKKHLRALGGDRGAVAPIMAVMIIPIAGALAMSVEVGQWYYVQRAMQNAADSAAIAAAINNSTTGSTYTAEAKAAAKEFGFVDGTAGTTVSAAKPACPAGTVAGSVCYQATISRVLPLSLAAVVGFRGDANSGFSQTIRASAIAVTGSSAVTKELCVVALSSAGETFTSNGGPKPDLGGCNIFSNGNARCNGHDLGADFGIAHGTSTGCGHAQISNADLLVDPYLGRATNIPTNTCPNYNGQNISGTLPSTLQKYCGNVKLTGDVTLSGANTVFVIYNGGLDLNNKTLKTASGASATVIFSGTNAVGPSHVPSGNGTIDINAPTSGVWSGVALYQDPNLTSGLDISYSGNKPTWNISGLVYLPKSNVTFSGAVNKSANGQSCFVLVAYTILVNGTGNIFANNTQCAAAGLTAPTATSSGAAIRERLVQ